MGSSLPEVCFVLPSGEVVDFQMYDGAVVPMEVPHDEWAGIYTTVRVTVLEDPAKKAATASSSVSGGAGSSSALPPMDEYVYDEEGNLVSMTPLAAPTPTPGGPLKRAGERRCFSIL